ncbi:Outer membrane protein assembly factor BamE [Aquicella siphonis]|uniref:Outer membrane protein assembly factor BamE n=1 Tax=Aquicella siphonis TaxID=254247 RepID=A0A5E4PIV1_9COXI|nr:outer membrane protein assembly factor BamE [Aquicella siphonis]VVC76378.1 Outer membrane protein assembly factor BamE [Aquicella siphonis]
MYKSLVCILMMLVLAGCSFFQIRKPIIEQGNIITNEAVSQLHTGMSSDQVIAIMGTPVVANILTPNRMEYVYTYQDGMSPRKEKHVTCLFEQGRLKEIQTR